MENGLLDSNAMHYLLFNGMILICKLNPLTENYANIWCYSGFIIKQYANHGEVDNDFLDELKIKQDLGL